MILLDTHTWIWMASDPQKLSREALSVLSVHLGQLYVSIASAWEIALLAQRGRLNLPVTPEAFIQRSVDHHGLIELPLGREAVMLSVCLPDIHNDPFDRVLVAECQLRRLKMVSCDRTIPLYPNVEVVW